MKRLVIGGPEKYDATFVDWPRKDYWKVPVYRSVLYDLYDLDESGQVADNLSYDDSIHVYRLEKLHLKYDNYVEVWVSTKLDYNFNMGKYLKLLTDKPSPWKSYKNNEKLALEYSYKAFGKWHVYHSITMESYMMLGKLANSNVLLRAQQEMRFYKVERIDQTAKIGPSSS